MLKMYSLFAVTLSVSILITPLPCIAQFAGGSGTVNDPYQIATVEHLQNTAKPEYLGKNFMIVNNIDAAATKNWNNGEGFEPIGSDDSTFTGTFDGKKHVINNLFIERVSKGRKYTGLFGRIGKNAIVMNITLLNVDIFGQVTERGGTGGLAGCYESPQALQNCHVTGIVRGNEYVGGLVGLNMFNARIIICSTAGITDGKGTGGIAGINYGEIFACFSLSSAKGFAAGGLVGTNQTGTIANCYAMGEVEGIGLAVGGFLGYNYGYVSGCYSTGAVKGSGDIGGFVGSNEQGNNTRNCFWDSETSGISGGGMNDGTGKTTAEMKAVATFTDTSTQGLYLAWDFIYNPNDDMQDNEIWNIDTEKNSGYPYLTWQDSGNTAIYDYPWKNKKTKELFSISFPNHNTVDIAVPTHCTASIIDIRGSVIKDNVNGSVDIAHLGNRIYFAVIKKGGKIIGFKRFIKVENVLY